MEYHPEMELSREASGERKLTVRDDQRRPQATPKVECLPELDDYRETDDG